MKDYERVPLMFQAQIDPRGNIQYGGNPKAANKWVEQWLKGCPPLPVEKTTPQEDSQKAWRRKTPTKPQIKMPQFGSEVKTKPYNVTWRFVTNGGQDKDVIRPVIGAKGIPYYPGSSMKGAFRRACNAEQALKYCGGEIEKEPGKKETIPATAKLRFHGAYPADMSWGNEENQKRLVDLVHPQWQRQIKDNSGSGANVQISLYKPTLKFGISSNDKTLSPEDWQEIWQIWEKALAQGIGSRVSAGYGQIKEVRDTERIILSVHLRGQGLASELLKEKKDKEKIPEFRPNMFKAALRGHTLRLLAGVTDADTAHKYTRELWGGFKEKDSKSTAVGKLGINFTANSFQWGEHKYNKPNGNPATPMPTYDLKSGTLDILYMPKKKQKKEKKELEEIVKHLIQFTLLLGGFGKSWRRVDHRIFFPEYFQKNNKPTIGCDWGFTKASENLYLNIKQDNLSNITQLLNRTQDKLIKFFNLKPSGYVSNWREVWHPEKVQVWGRIAKNEAEIKTVAWFHQPYSGNKSIKNTELTGTMGTTGRIWHRIYPRYIKNKGGMKHKGQYIELLTIFPDDRSDNTQEFLDYLKLSHTFKLLFGGKT